MLFFDLFRHEPAFTHVRAGETLFHEGDTGTFMYVLIVGTAQILVQKHAVERLIPGGIAGEMAMLDELPRSATVLAITDCTFAEIDRKRFHFLVTETPLFAIEVMRMMAMRLRSCDQAVVAATEVSASPADGDA